MLPSHARGPRYTLRRIQRSHPALKHISLVTVALVVLWLYTIHQGERAVFASKINSCAWPTSETWPGNAEPHRALLIADPQLVDAHTYPGRPWPLSAFTEIYTDRYMARSYKLINKELDPDSIIFLGDMFDGGREWAPQQRRKLSNMVKWAMEVRSPATAEVPKEMSKVSIPDPGWEHEKAKRDVDIIDELKLKKPMELDASDLTSYSHGEGGRWKEYGNRYYENEYRRFGRIFFEESQLYPIQSHGVELIGQQSQDPVNLHNGARNRPRKQYQLYLRHRDIVSSLPGNHDLGFGSGVQLSVRARYKWHFGEMNRVDVLGNHSFVSIDALSLAAWSQFEADGTPSTDKDSQDRVAIYAGAQAFLDDLPTAARQAAKKNLERYYPAKAPRTLWKHSSIMTDDVSENETLPATSSSKGHLPAVLLSHVPLYRDADTFCGPLRERGRALSLTGGYQYQNVLTRELSNTITAKVNRIGPLKEIFSGDDHDYCDVTHASAQQSIREETVKSFSWAMGVRHPGFHLVSLYNPIDAEGKSLSGGVTIQTRLCLLPDQLGIFIRYGTLAGATLFVLLLRAVILALRKPDIEEEDEVPTFEISKLISQGFIKVKELTSDRKPASKHRHRASSSALKPPPSMNLSVQRSTNARARSVSPGIGFGGISPFQAPLIDQAGYYPTLRHNSNPGSDDEESRIGDMDYLEDDTQAKWRRRARPRGKFRRAWDDFTGGLLLVGGIAFCYYIVLIRAG